MIFTRLLRLLHDMFSHLLSVDGILTLHGVREIEKFELNVLLGIVRRYFASIWNDLHRLDLRATYPRVTWLPKRSIVFV
jgi:hypothetical protein